MRRLITLLVLLATALPAVAQVPAPGSGVLSDDKFSGPFPGGWRFARGEPAATGSQAMIASNSMLASEAGLEILRAGGNAVDAAVAVGFALAVTYPQAGNIGGGGFMVIRMADGRTAAIDYREMAPLAATRDMFVDPATGRLTNKSTVGHLASGVPGAVAGMAAALQRFGTMPLSRVMQPAIRLARDGFVMDTALSRTLEAAKPLIGRFAGAELFFPGGQVVAPGTRFRQPDLARTLQAIADRGPRAFYAGAVAKAVADEMRRGGGIMTEADLAGYRPAWRTPIVSSYRGHKFVAMPPSSSGGITVTQTLNILEASGPLPPYGSTAYYHLLAEAFRRSFADRNETLGDPDFVKVPLARLTSKDYAAGLARWIDRAHATPSTALAPRRESDQTTHYSVVDARGNAVATTTTVNGYFGSGVWIPGGGFFMNNEMDDFAAQPGSPNMFGLVQGEANAVAPRKRMLSAMSPTIVLDPQGKVELVVGAAGGPTIITAVTQVILNVIEHRMPLADAMRAPRLHHQALPDAIRYETGGIPAAVADSLKAMGHQLATQAGIANVNAIARAPGGGWVGVREPRSVGGAVGY